MMSHSHSIDDTGIFYLHLPYFTIKKTTIHVGKSYNRPMDASGDFISDHLTPTTGTCCCLYHGNLRGPPQSYPPPIIRGLIKGNQWLIVP